MVAIYSFSREKKKLKRLIAVIDANLFDIYTLNCFLYLIGYIVRMTPFKLDERGLNPNSKTLDFLVQNV